MQNIWKRLLSVLLAAVLLCGAVPAVTHAEDWTETFQCGENVECFINHSTGLMILRGSGEMGNYHLGGFMWTYGVRTLVIEEGVTRIGADAFSQMMDLQYVSIPRSMRSIGSYAFYDCIKLECVTIPDAVTTLGDNAFWGCGSLKRVVLGSGIRKIEDETFNRCSRLQSLTIPYGVTSIGILAFAHCTSMEYVHIPSSVTTFNDYTFLTDSPAYICSDSANSAAKRIADTVGISFRVCSGHPDTHTHSYTSIVTAQPTCEKAGSRTLICTVCGSSYTEAIAKTAHTLREEVTQPTCTQPGARRKVCTVCGATAEETVIPASGHSFGSAVTIQPNCTSKGLRTYTCSVCGDSYTEEIAKTAHTPQAVTEPATCQAEGSQYTKCAVCGSILGGVAILPKGDHTPAAAVKENEIPATCTAAGKYDEAVYCRECGTELSRRSVETPALGHSFTKYVYNNDATTDKDGTKTAKCDRCDVSDTVSAPGTKLRPSTVSIKNYTANKTVDYRTTITFTADVKNPVTGAKTHWFIDGKDAGAGDTYTVKEAKKDFTVQAKYMQDGKVLAESEIETVKVNSGFFAKLTAFFRALFGQLPKVVQEYLGVEYADRLA